MTDKKQIQEFLGIELPQLQKCAESVDDKALTKAKKIILNAEKKHGRVHDAAGDLHAGR